MSHSRGSFAISRRSISHNNSLVFRTSQKNRDVSRVSLLQSNSPSSQKPDDITEQKTQSHTGAKSGKRTSQEHRNTGGKTYKRRARKTRRVRRTRK
jgi:hypothetical protein